MEKEESTYDFMVDLFQDAKIKKLIKSLNEEDDDKIIIEQLINDKDQ